MEDLRQTADNSLLLDALGHLRDIGLRINQLNLGDPAARDALLHLVVESAIRIVPGAVAIIYTYDAGRQAIDPASRVAAGAPGAALRDDRPRPTGLGARALARGRPVLSHEEPDLELHPAQQASGARAAVCLPLIVAEQPLGVLYVYLLEDRRLSAMELLLLANLINQAATALHHAGQFTDVRRNLARKEDELTLLRHAGLLISSRTRLEETLEAILQMALEVTGARYGIFRLVDSSGQHLVMRAIAGDRLGRPAVETLPINATSIMGWVARARQPINISDVSQPPWSRIYYPLDHGLQMHSELAVPLIGAAGRLEGVLNLESPEIAAFSEADSHLLQALASQAVIAIQEVRLLDGLRETSGRLLARPAREVLAHLADLACDLLNTPAAAVWISSRDQLSLAAASAGYPAPRLQTPDEALVRRALSTGSTLTYQWPQPSNAEATPAYALVTPIRTTSDAPPLGAFVVHARRHSEMSGGSGPAEWDKKVLAILAHYAALALESATRQQALREAQEAHAIAETFAAMGDIAANLLHHLNNKVGAIPVRVEGIQDKCAPALEANPYLAANLIEIERAALDAMAAVRERLSLLRPIERTAVSVADCVADALAATRLPATLTVDAAGLDRLPPVLASREGLALVISNLLDNATEAMVATEAMAGVEAMAAAEATGGQGRITISGSVQSESVELTISDDGPGIAPALQGRIFEFDFSGRRADPHRTGAVHGKLGFGLWWVKTLMTRLGGAITVESDGHSGAAFRLRLPRAFGEEAG